MTIAQDLAAAAETLTEDAAIMRAVVLGPVAGAGSEIETEEGTVKSLRRLQAEANPTVRSTSSVQIGYGTKYFVPEGDHYLAVRAFVKMESRADLANHMYGQIMAIVDGTLEIAISKFEGSGTYGDWTIRVSGASGDTGPQGAPGASRLINVRVATTDAKLPADLTAGSSVDDVPLAANDLVLRRTGSNATINGIYVVQASGGAVRHADFDAYADHAEVFVAVEEGTRYGRTLWQCTATRTGTIGSTDLIFVEKTGLEPILEPRYDIINAGGKILIPAMYWKYRDDSGHGLTSPSDGSRYWEVDASASPTTITRYYFDLDLVASNPIVTATGSAWPVKPSWRRAEIGHSINGVFHSKFSVAGRPGSAGIAKNIFTEGNDPDHAPVKANGSSVVDVVDMTLNAMGILRGVMRTSSFSAYGLSTRRTRGSDWVACRYYVKANNDAPSWDFEDAGVWGYRYGNRTVLADALPQLEKIHSASLRSYLVFGKVVHDFNRFMIGIQKKVGDTSNYTVCGIQFAMSRNGPISWINRDDYDSKVLGLARPSVPSPIMGGELFLVEGRPAKVYLENIVPLRDEREFYGALELDTSTDDTASTYEVAGPRHLELDVSKFPSGTSAAYLRVWPDRKPQDTRFELPISVRKVAGSGHSKSPKVLVIGDSISNRRLLQLVDARLQLVGITPVWVGSVATADSDTSPSNSEGLFGECREGRGLGGTLGCTTNCVASTPLTDAKVAEYVAGASGLTVKMTRVGYNPFLRPKAGDGSEDAIAKNGQVFDFEGAWLDRLSPHIASVVMPDIVISLLGTNDWTDDGPAFITPNFQFAIPRMLDSILEAKADMKIGVGMTAFAEGEYAIDGQQKWAAMMGELVGQVNTYRAANPEASVSVINGWAHMTPYSGWTLDPTVTVNPVTGHRFPRTTDARHPVRAPRQQLADTIAAFIANVA